jgi:hypothetical protein
MKLLTTNAGSIVFDGSLYQLGNDIFDLYKDVRDNIYTLVIPAMIMYNLKKSLLKE